MDHSSATDQSRRLNRRFVALAAQWQGAAASELGSEPWAKLDQVTQRELGHEQRDRALDRMAATRPSSERAYTVIANMRSGRRSGERMTQSTSARRRRANILKRQGELALARLLPGIEEGGVSVVQRFWLTHSILVETDRSGLAGLASRADICSINHNKTVLFPTLDASRGIVGGTQVENTLGFDGTGIDVAICDTGVDFTHPALVGVAGSSQDFSGEGMGDLHGHGTHCAGIVASTDANRRGMAPGCTVHDYKHLSSTGGGDPANAILAIQQTVTDGRQVASHSWGASHVNGAWTCAAGDCVLCTAADAAVGGGQAFIVAAGNDATIGCTDSADTRIGCPGNARLVITVGATNDRDQMAIGNDDNPFSSFGPTPDGRAKPDLAAPGQDIGSARATTGNDMNGGATVIDANWCEVDGTSQATPHVAGTAALMLQKNPALTPQDVKDLLMQSAVDIGETPENMGAGRLDALAAVNAA